MTRSAFVIAFVALVVACSSSDNSSTSSSGSSGSSSGSSGSSTPAHTCAQLSVCCDKVGDATVKKQCTDARDAAKGNDDDCNADYAAYCP